MGFRGGVVPGVGSLLGGFPVGVAFAGGMDLVGAGAVPAEGFLMPLAVDLTASEVFLVPAGTSLVDEPVDLTAGAVVGRVLDNRLPPLAAAALLPTVLVVLLVLLPVSKQIWIKDKKLIFT